MSAIGSRQWRRGFTLIEIMAATAILALGVVFVYQALLNCLDAYDYYESYFFVSEEVSEKLALAQLELTTTGRFLGERSGKFLNRNREFSWELSCVPAGANEDLFRIDLNVLWQSARRKLSMSREAYALFKKEIIVKRTEGR